MYNATDASFEMKRKIPVVGIPLDGRRCMRWMDRFEDTSFNLGCLSELVKGWRISITRCSLLRQGVRLSMALVVGSQIMAFA